MPEDITTVVPAAVAPVPDPAPEEAPPMAEPPDDEAEYMISAAEILGLEPEQQTETENKGEDGAARVEEPKIETAQTTVDQTKGKTQIVPPPAYKDQAAIDHAIGARLEAERRKLEPDLSLARSIKRLHPGISNAEILRRIEEKRAEDLGYTPEQMAFIQNRDNTETGKAPEPEQIPAGEADAAEYQKMAQQILSEAPALKAVYPGFDPVAFIQKDPNAVLLMKKGLTLKQAYELSNMDAILAAERAAAKAQGEQATVDSIRNRNERVPAPGKGKSGVLGKLDIANMSDADFAKLEEQVRAGRYVKV